MVLFSALDATVLRTSNGLGINEVVSEILLVLNLS